MRLYCVKFDNDACRNVGVMPGHTDRRTRLCLLDDDDGDDENKNDDDDNDECDNYSYKGECCLCLKNMLRCCIYLLFEIKRN